MTLLEGKAIVFASRNRVLAFHEGMTEPVCLTARLGEPRETEITSVLLHENCLYDAGHDGVVYNTLTNAPVIAHRRATNPVYKLASSDGDLIALEGVREGQSGVGVARVFRVADNHTLRQFGVKWDTHGSDLSYRNNSLDLAVAGPEMYVSSQNVVKFREYSSIDRLTDYTSDFVHLASNGETVVAVSYQNPQTHPRGTEVRRMPDNKLLAFWDYKRFGSAGLHGCIALHGDVLVFGSSMVSQKGNHLSGFRITPEMHTTSKGVEVTPELVLQNAFDEPLMYGSGNPLLIVSRDELERLLAN